MWGRGVARAAAALGCGFALLALAGIASAGDSNLQQTSPLVWVMIAIAVGGAFVVYVILVWAVLRFRDPRTRGRRYG